MQVERDIGAAAQYWGKRKLEFIEAPAIAFEKIIRPAIYFERDPSPIVEAQLNVAFTEWLLFDVELDERGSLLRRYARKPPSGVCEGRAERLRQVCDTHLFSEFAIREKRPAAGTVDLVDIFDGEARTVRDVRLARRDGWDVGTVSMRIARVDGVWMPVGQTVMYDRCRFDPSWIPVEDDAGTSGMRLLDLVHDVYGIDGAYRESVSLRELEG